MAAATDDLDVGLFIYNAGADTNNGTLLEQPVDDLLALARRNCTTVLASCHHFGGRLVAHGHGGVVLVTSGAAWVGGSHIAAYGATKAFDLVLAERPLGRVARARCRRARPRARRTDTPSLRRSLETHGGDLGELADPAVVTTEALDHLADGPTWSFGMPDPTGPSPFGPIPAARPSSS